MKAVIMAGGEGSRLRPLTCNLPKPLARLCGKPVLEYIYDLLIRHGVGEACVSLGYMAGSITGQYPARAYRQLQLEFVTEEQPMGTAGGVALCARGWDDDFLVISGDAMCDLDLTAAREFHQSSGAAVTILGVEVEDPREYGLMQIDEQGRVLGFIEKPAWGQATTNLANTGIYIIRPDIMSLVPQNEKFDFAQGLFPLLLQQGELIACCKLDGYWCDIGDLSAYLRCQHDMMEHKVQCALPAAPQDNRGVYLRGNNPRNDYTVIPPVFIGEDVQIGEGAVIGPHAVLDDGCMVGPGAKIRGSVLLQNVSVSQNACLTGAIVCAGAQVRRDAQLFEGCAVGEKAVVGAGAVIQPDIAVWPQKHVEPQSVVSAHVKYGCQGAALFDDGGIGGAEGMPLSPESCAAIGSAIGSVKSCKKAGIACDGTGRARALSLALMSGLMDSGSHVWNFNDCFEAQLSFFTAFCGLGIGIYVSGGEEPAIQICGEGGLSVPRYLEREIEAKLRRGEFQRCTGEDVKEIADMSSIRMMYAREMMKLAPMGLEGIGARVTSASHAVQSLAEETLSRLDCSINQGGLMLELNENGTELAAQEHDRHYSDERILAICCKHELVHGDIALPYDAPEMLDALAAHEGRAALRYLSSPADQSDSAARRLSSKQIWVRDGLYRAVKLLAIMKETGRSLTELSAALPPFYIEKKSFALPCPPSMLQEMLGEPQGDSQPDTAREGLLLRRENGRILITPGKSGRRVQVLAEAASMEIAQELCESIGEIITKSL